MCTKNQIIIFRKESSVYMVLKLGYSDTAYSSDSRVIEEVCSVLIGALTRFDLMMRL